MCGGLGSFASSYKGKEEVRFEVSAAGCGFMDPHLDGISSAWSWSFYNRKLNLVRIKYLGRKQLRMHGTNLFIFLVTN